MRWRWSWAVASNARAIENARRASTALSRGRVEREEVELFLRQRYGVGGVAPDADARSAASSR
jgi:hypothetical protein